MSEELEIAIEAAKQGAAKAFTYFGHNPSVTIKPDHSPVTQADKESEKAIIDFILSKDANANFIGEESGGSLNVEEAWIIDPVDGTKNFMRGIPLWAILIAHYKNGICDIGISYVPSQNQLCFAQRRQGAYINDQQVHVSQIGKLADAYFSHGEARYFKNTESLLQIAKTAFTERCHGDAFTYNQLAAGNIDIVVDAANHVWDSAPFSVIIEEAGGKVSDMKGNPWTLKSTDFVASNGLLHSEVIEILNTNR